MANQISIRPELCFVNLPAEDWESALRALADKLLAQGLVKETYADNVVRREKNFATGLALKGNVNIAVPHTDCEFVNETAIAVATLKKPVEFVQMGTTDEKVSVQVLVMLAIKEPHGQIEILSQVIKLVAQSRGMAEAIANCKDGKEIYDIFIEKLQDTKL